MPNIPITMPAVTASIAKAMSDTKSKTALTPTEEYIPGNFEVAGVEATPSPRINIEDSTLNNARKAIADTMAKSGGYPITPIPEEMKPKTVKENLKNALLGLIPYYGPARNLSQRQKMAYATLQYQAQQTKDQREYEALKGYHDKMFDKQVEQQAWADKQNSMLNFVQLNWPNAPKELMMSAVSIPLPSSLNVAKKNVRVKPYSATGEKWDGDYIPAVQSGDGGYTYRDPWTGQITTQDVSQIWDRMPEKQEFAPKAPTREQVITDEQGNKWWANPVTQQLEKVMSPTTGQQMGTRVKPESLYPVRMHDPATGKNVLRFVPKEEGKEYQLPLTQSQQMMKGREAKIRVYAQKMKAISMRLITERNALKQRAKAMRMGFEAFVKGHPDYRVYEDLKESMGMLLARMVESGRLSDLDREIWTQTLPNIFKDNVQSATDKWTMLEDIHGLALTPSENEFRIGQVVEQEGIKYKIVDIDEKGQLIGEPLKEGE